MSSLLANSHRKKIGSLMRKSIADKKKIRLEVPADQSTYSFRHFFCSKNVAVYFGNVVGKQYIVCDYRFVSLSHVPLMIEIYRNQTHSDWKDGSMYYRLCVRTMGFSNTHCSREA